MVRECCLRTLDSFNDEELLTGSCRWESACTDEFTCPLFRFTDEEIYAELHARGIDCDTFLS